MTQETTMSWVSHIFWLILGAHAYGIPSTCFILASHSKTTTPISIPHVEINHKWLSVWVKPYTPKMWYNPNNESLLEYGFLSVSDTPFVFICHVEMPKKKPTKRFSPVRWTYLEVSWSGGAPRLSISGFSIINQAFGGTPIAGNLPFHTQKTIKNQRSIWFDLQPKRCEPRDLEVGPKSNSKQTWSFLGTTKNNR